MRLMSRGQQEGADMVEKELGRYQEFLECAVMRRDHAEQITSRDTTILWEPSSLEKVNGL